MTAHMQLDGSWAECPAPESCALKFHFDNMGVAEAEAMPRELLDPLLEILDPPSKVSESGMKMWWDEQGRAHRDYDLPAIVTKERLIWCREDLLYRAGGKPNVICPLDDIAYWYDTDNTIKNCVENWSKQ